MFSETRLLHSPQCLENLHELADVSWLIPGYVVQQRSTLVDHEDGPMAAPAVFSYHTKEFGRLKLLVTDQRERAPFHSFGEPLVGL